jgi:hypothetical protein
LSAIGFYLQVIHAFEVIQAPYMIVGAFGGLAYGIARATFDVDILVDLSEPDFEALARLFPSPRYYADPEMMRNSMREGTLFNIIDSELGVKADLVPLIREPDYEMAFSRRVRQPLQDESGEIFEAWYAQPADIIIGKLNAWTEGRSAKHPSDILSILLFSMSGLGNQPIDYQAVSAQAARIGAETSQLWQALLTRARRESGALQ